MSIENLPETVYIQFIDNKCIAVNNEYFYKSQYQNDFGELDFTIDLIKNNLSDNLKNAEFYSIFWDKNSPNDSGFNVLVDGYFQFDLTEENYNRYVKPYVDIWQQVKDKKDQEQQQAQEEYAKFSSRQLRAYDLVNENYQSALENAPVTTSLGYDADISTDSIASLLGTKVNFENNTYTNTVFVDYYNIDRNVNEQQLNTIISEINLTQNHLRNQKQDYIAQIKNTYDNDSLNAILPTLKFTTLDFTQDVDPANEDNVKQYKEVEITIKQCDMLNTIDNM